VQTPNRAAYLFEIERRTSERTAKDGSTFDWEEPFSGLIASPPAEMAPNDWIPRVMDGIRRESGIMARVRKYCPGTLVDDYRRSSSKDDEIAGHSTVVGALLKVDIVIPTAKAKRAKPKAG
jgi:hypothetical protein